MKDELLQQQQEQVDILRETSLPTQLDQLKQKERGTLREGKELMELALDMVSLFILVFEIYIHCVHIFAT